MTESTDLRELRASHPAPRPIELSDAHRERLAQRVGATIAITDRRRRRLQTTGQLALVVGCVLAVLALGIAGRSDRSRPTATARAVAAAPAAVAVLHRAASAALTAPEPTVAKDQFV